MDNQVRILNDYHVCTDGSITRAELVVENFLISHSKTMVREILDKHKLEEFKDWKDYDCDCCVDALLLFATPYNIFRLKAVIVDLAAVSRREKAKYEATIAEGEALCQECSKALIKAVDEINQLTGVEE